MCIPVSDGVLYISIKSIWSNVSFKASVSLLMFCLDDLSIGVNGMLKCPTVIVLLSVYPSMSVNMCPYKFSCSYVGCIYIELAKKFIWVFP